MLVVGTVISVTGESVQLPDENHVKQPLFAVVDHPLKIRAVCRSGGQCPVNIVSNNTDTEFFNKWSARFNKNSFFIRQIVDDSFTEKHTGLHHQDVNVNLCGVASAEELRKSLLNSTLYFHSSYIENSPNAVCEAQILGLPVVASRVGGTDSMVEHGKTGFLYPVTDPYMAAYYIGRMIEDKEENVKIGKEAREVALVRHDKGKIVEELLKTYQEIVDTK